MKSPLRLLDGMDGEDVHIRMLLVELIEVTVACAYGMSTVPRRYLARRTSIRKTGFLPLELAMRHISNASCPIIQG